MFGGLYISRDRLVACRAASSDPVRWIVIHMYGIPEWVGGVDVSTTEAPFRVSDGEAKLAAVRLGLGITTLPCFVGDADPLLVRVPGTALHMYGTLWILTQGKTRKTKRVRVFTKFVFRRYEIDQTRHVSAETGETLGRRSDPLPCRSSSLPTRL